MNAQSRNTASVASDTPAPLGLDAALAQKVVDYVADRLAGADFATAERLLDEFVDRLRHLADIAAVERSIAAADAIALQGLGGIDAARNLLALIKNIGQS
ncbi:MAG TPA: hypothetical protein VHX65_02815 [Pirellulales bacterium]|jgi:hypothetical protein|nr:hypothetical protein [Pirellulales bacterium]